jgi:hypothetical protein
MGFRLMLLALLVVGCLGDFGALPPSENVDAGADAAPE